MKSRILLEWGDIFKFKPNLLVMISVKSMPENMLNIFTYESSFKPHNDL